MDKAHRVMLMSGFLGSGKTTSMVAVGNELKRRGLTPALITNDLGSALVDTEFVMQAGIPVLEISNGCLCHDVDQLVEKFNAHIDAVDPDIILFEPVGSCVDMVEHVYGDLHKRFGSEYILAPVSALVDPVRYQAIYMGIGEDTFPAEISYMFKKQLEEADVLLISKVDSLDDESVLRIEEDLRRNFPHAKVLPISSFMNLNIDKWVEYVLTHETAYISLDIDMEYVMNGAAKMGWFNCVVDIEFGETVDISCLCSNYLSAVRDQLRLLGGEMAHAKVIATQGESFCRAALTTCNDEPKLTGDLKKCAGTVRLNVNIRALMDPTRLSSIMRESLRETLSESKSTILSTELQSFASAQEAPDMCSVPC